MNKAVSSFLCLLLAAVLTGCCSDMAATENSLLVKTRTIYLEPGASEGNYPGAVKGRHETSMAFQTGGRILQRFVQAGDHVHAGDVLMTIDSRDMIQQTTQGEAQIVSALAQLEQARANLKRYKALYNQETISLSVLKEYQDACEAAEASYNQAVAAVKQGRNAAGYSKLVAGSDGIISSVTADVGQMVAPGQQVLTLVQPQDLEVEINLPENRFMNVAVGQLVDVSFWSLNNQTVTGTIREISPLADTVARTYKIRISLPSPPDKLKPGMTASAKIIGARLHQHMPASTVHDFIVLPMPAAYDLPDTGRRP